MSYYYMFSEGSYSDYCVGGLYKSEHKLDEKYFIEYIRNMIIEQIDENWPEAVAAIKGWDVEYISTISNKYNVGTKLFSVQVGERPNYGYAGYDGWIKAYLLWEKEQEIDLDYTSKLQSDGILTKIEYDEIWEG